jgi:uncharacterized protein YeaO (DUF488 family)
VTSEQPPPRIVTGSVYEPPTDPYSRFLVSRTWPSGVPRGAVDQWDRDLAPSAALLEAWRSGAIDDATFEARYEAELLEQPAVLAWTVRQAALVGIALVDDAEAEPSPRTVLAAILARHVPGEEDANER